MPRKNLFYSGKKPTKLLRLIEIVGDSETLTLLKDDFQTGRKYCPRGAISLIYTLTHKEDYRGEFRVEPSAEQVIQKYKERLAKEED